MKRIFSLTIFSLFVLVGHTQNVGNLYKSAKKALEKYQQGETDKIEEAFQSIEQIIPLLENMEPKKAAKYWLKAGEVYNEVALGDYKQFLIYNDHQPLHPLASLKAYDALVNTAENADKKWDKKQALDELVKTATFITNEGIAAYNTEAYENAYGSFQKVEAIRAFLNEAEHPSILSKPTEYRQHIYRTALAAKRAEKNDEAIALFEKLQEQKFNNAVIFSSLHELYMANNEKAKARNILQDGRELFPESNALQIAEINWYMAEGELEALISRLKAALESDPENISFYISLGHIYAEKQNESADQGDFQTAQDHFNESKYYFTRALDVDDQHAPALYNLGALHYNKAAVITKELNLLEGDNSANNVRTIVAKQSQMATFLDQALPYFQKAEAADPNDLATLTALKEIYTRKDDSSMAVEFSERIAKIEAGEELNKSFF